MGYIKYSSNNSGGSWRLSDQNWRDLAEAGWKVKWARLSHVYENGMHIYDNDGTPLLVGPEDPRHDDMFSTRSTDGVYRDMGNLAIYAYRVGLSLEDAKAEFSIITDKDPEEIGCPCCGQPHNFHEYD